VLVIVLQDYPNYVSIGNVSAYDFANTTFTVSAWFKSSRVSDANESNYIITKRTTTAPNGGWLLRVNSDGTVHARLGDASATTAAGRTSVRTYYDNN